MDPTTPENKNVPYRLPSLNEIKAFWKYLGMDGLLSMILFFLSIVIMVLAGVATFSIIFNTPAVPVNNYLGLAILIILLSFLIDIVIIPGEVRSWKSLLGEKIKPGITDEELTRTISDSIPKRYYAISMGVIAMSILCLAVATMGKILAFPILATIILLIVVILNVFIFIAGFLPLMISNRYLFRKVLAEKYQDMYTFPGRYKHVILGLIFFDVLAVVLAFYNAIHGLSPLRTLILLLGFIINAVILIGFSGYSVLEGESESFRRTRVPLITFLLILIMLLSLVSIAAILIYTYLTRSFSNFTVFASFLFIICPSIITLAFAPQKKIRSLIRKFAGPRARA